MSIKAGDKMPEGKFTRMTSDGPKKLTTGELFDGKTVVLFSVPGAFTPTATPSTCRASSNTPRPSRRRASTP